ncbi:MAG: twin-arginine translocase subunit TatC, partial [Thermodesulfobacteriota bacterium]|nr:twin-arginine translocase subunit TatC [Thermodesulfobacteriota bacterium]
FFLSFATDHIRPLPSIKEYLTFSSKLLLAFGVMFELPLFTLFLTKVGLINYKQLVHNRKYAILLVFVFSAILTPPDVVTQLLMAGPLLILFEISIFITRVSGKKK